MPCFLFDCLESKTCDRCNRIFSYELHCWNAYWIVENEIEQVIIGGGSGGGFAAGGGAAARGASGGGESAAAAKEEEKKKEESEEEEGDFGFDLFG